MTNEWTVYRTRFLIKAKQLTEPLAFVDFLGREHAGRKGDYLVESSDGYRSIVRRAIFEDVYVPMELVAAAVPAKITPARAVSAWLYPSEAGTASPSCGKRAS